MAHHEEALPRTVLALVVDDNRDAADLLCHLLELLGCQTAVAHDGPAAVRVAAAMQPHLAIVDLGLPGFDGCEVLRRLKASGCAGTGLHVCLTGHGGPRERDRCADVGFDEFWSKPLDPKELRRLIACARDKVNQHEAHAPQPCAHPGRSGEEGQHNGTASH